MSLNHSDAPPVTDPLIGHKLDGRYELLKLLGEGGMGKVYLARHTWIGDEVAVKILHPNYVTDEEALERFREEARNAAQLHHPNVVAIRDGGEAREGNINIYIVMEFIEGKTLRDILNKEGKIPPERAVALMRQICSGVDVGHRRRKPGDLQCPIIHRDLKPENVMVIQPDGEGKRETVKILDFGLAKPLDGENRLVKTLDGQILGTPYYMSPEQWRNEASAKPDQRSDVYSLGATLYEMLAGKRPFLANNIADMMHQHLYDSPPPLDDDGIPSSLKAVVMRALKKEPKERQGDALELSNDLFKAIQPPDMQQSTLHESAANLIRSVPEPTLRDFEFSVIKINGGGEELAREKKSAKFFAEVIDTVELKMVKVEEGSFLMGSPPKEPGRGNDEGPQRLVRVRPFYLGMYEVTQAQWREVARLPKVDVDLPASPSFFTGGSRPVEQVSWDEAMEFCKRLSEKTGRRYRLPSEAEWEYACRAKSEAAFHFGENIRARTANYHGRFSYGAAPEEDIYRGATTPVGSLNVANDFGLYDMHGNVLEWCEDVYHASYHGAPNDGRAWVNGGGSPLRVARGGSWRGDAIGCGSAARSPYAPDTRENDLGFRIALSLTT